MGQTLWLDGLRGVAAAIVAIFHAKELEPESIFGFLSRSFWDDPPEQNRRFIQLPPVYWIFKPPVRNLIWRIETGQAFPGTIEAS